MIIEANETICSTGYQIYNLGTGWTYECGYAAKQHETGIYFVDVEIQVPDLFFGGYCHGAYITFVVRNLKDIDKHIEGTVIPRLEKKIMARLEQKKSLVD